MSSNNYLPGDDVSMGYSSNTQSYYHVEPITKEKKLRPWKPEEVPHLCVVRHPAWFGGWAVITEQINDCVYIPNLGTHANRVTLTDLLQDYEYSTDNGATWKPCGVEESES